MADITITFQNLTPNPLFTTVAGSGGGAWSRVAYPVSGWQEGQPSGDLRVPVSGYPAYKTSMTPSGVMMTEPFSTDTSVTFAIFAVDE